MTKTARLAVDIGGTFTDLVLALPDRSLSAKVLTTSDAPERAVLEGTAAILEKAGINAADLARIIHQELADVVYPFEISYDFAVESQNPRIQRPHPP